MKRLISDARPALSDVRYTSDSPGMQQETIYEIRLREVLDEKWSAYFAPFKLSTDDEEILLTGVIHDQAELFGVLLKIRDMGLSLVSVNPVEY